MEREYRITGTPEEICNILQSEFLMHKDLAKFVASTLISNAANEDEKEAINENAENWWFSTDTAYTSIFLNSRYTISITKLKKEILGKLFIVFGVFATKREWTMVSAIFELMVSSYESFGYLEDYEWCIFKGAYELSKRGYFSASNLMEKYKGTEGICLFLDKEWNCSWRQNEECGLTEKKIEEILNELCGKELLKKIDDRLFGVVM